MSEQELDGIQGLPDRQQMNLVIENRAALNRDECGALCTMTLLRVRRVRKVAVAHRT